MKPVRWGKPVRPRKADRGHSPALYGWRDVYGRKRSYVRCQCGTRLSGQGDEGGLASYRKHRKRKLDKLDQLGLAS